MRPRAGARASRRAGFTLIETLVALVVFAAVALVAQRGMVTARLGLDRVQSTLAAEQVARSIVETQLGTLVQGPGEFAGQIDGLAWSIVATPIPLPIPPPAARPAGGTAAPAGQSGQAPAVTPAPGGAPDADADESRWRVLRVVVTVANGRGRPLKVETVKTFEIPE